MKKRGRPRPPGTTTTVPVNEEEEEQEKKKKPSRNPATCIECGKVFASGWKGVKRHWLLYHFPWKEFNCRYEYCGEKFGNADELFFHHRVAHPHFELKESKTILCSVCKGSSMPFARESDLWRHEWEYHDVSLVLASAGKKHTRRLDMWGGRELLFGFYPVPESALPMDTGADDALPCPDAGDVVLWGDET